MPRPLHLVASALLVIACAAGAGGALAAADAAGGFSLARLQEASRGVRTLRIPFVQEKHLAIFDEPVITPGVIEIDRDLGALRWEFTGRSTMILRDGRIRRWGAEGREESGLDRDPSLAAMGAQMEALLSGDWGTVQKYFTATPDPGGAPVLVLVPSDPALARYLARLDLRFRADLSAPESLSLEAAGGDRTLYRFAPPEIGIAIAPARFAGP